jgi:hypothetical protein
MECSKRATCSNIFVHNMRHCASKRMPMEHKEQGKNVQRMQSMSGGMSMEHEEQKINVNSHFVEFLARQPGNVA